MAAPLSDTKLCLDFNIFLNALKNSRLIDDRIVHELNTILPTQSFSKGVNVSDKCKDLYDLMQSSHSSRVGAIQHCINMQKDKTKELAEKREGDLENYRLKKQLSKEQSNLRLFQQELSIEEIVQQRAQKVFYERCREYYQPDS